MARDWRVDTLRGYFLVGMTLGHFPNPLVRFTGYTFGYASAPDGFVFLSGLVSAWVYLRVQERRGCAAMVSKMFRRVRTIYLTHILLLVLGILFASRLALGVHRAGDHPWQRLFSGALLFDQSGLDAILPMYCIFLAVAPLALREFRQGRAWPIGLISALLWISAQFGLGDSPFFSSDPHRVDFNLLAWQAYFMAGLFVGSLRMGARERDEESSGHGKSRILLAVCVVIASLLLVDRHSMWLRGVHPLLGFTAYPDHNPVRFLNAVCLGYIIWWIPRTVDAAAMKLGIFRFLNFLGGHALQVFAFSMLLTRFETNAIAGFSRPEKTVVALLTVLSLGLPALVHKALQERRTRADAAPNQIRIGYRWLFATMK